jgi:hypothetical protein
MNADLPRRALLSRFVSQAMQFLFESANPFRGLGPRLGLGSLLGFDPRLRLDLSPAPPPKPPPPPRQYP